MNTIELLEVCRERLNYDPLSGVFTWKVTAGTRAKAGDIAGSVGKNGYIRIGLADNTESKHYRAHRLAWLLTTGNLPIDLIDHINGVKTDNRWCNLRAATHTENQHNSKKATNNTTTFKGVSFYKRLNKFQAKISLHSKRLHLGYFLTAEEAHAAYCVAAKELHKQFANYG